MNITSVASNYTFFSTKRDNKDQLDFFLFLIFKETNEQQARWEMCKIRSRKRNKRKRKDKEMRIKK